MDVVTTSLEALIQRATNPLNEKPDIAAIEAFCVMLGKESKGVHVASRLLATHIQSTSEKEALQALTLLDTCMKRCGRTFHTEVGKFRFLNVMIKLVSPKYLGNKTPEAVRNKILDLLQAWTKDYPREVKIKETYEMLKKQGVIKEQVYPMSSIEYEEAAKFPKPRSRIFEDEEKTKLLQELLQSKDPFDLKLANKLIKSMVKDDEKRAQLNSQRNMDLESVHNNVKLLSEMLDSYVPEKSSAEDVELMKELYDACERLKPTVTRLGNESQGNEELREVIAAHDELTQVFEKYASVLLLGGGGIRGGSNVNRSTPSSLLDLSSPSDIINAPCSEFNEKNAANPPEKRQSDMEMLGDIFSSLGNTLEASSSTPDTTLLLPDTNIMQPISILPSVTKPTKAAESSVATVKMDSKAKALEDLNQLGESLLKESLSQNNSILRSNFNSVSKPLKDIVAADSSATNLMNVSQPPTNPSFLVASETCQNLQSKNIAVANCLGEQLSKITIADNNRDLADFGDLLNDDDAMLDASSLPSQIGDNQSDANQKNNVPGGTVSAASTFPDVEIKPLTDINVTIDSIKPGTIRPLTVIEEKNGITVVLHFPKDSPREDVTVIVVTTMSKNSKALSNYLFQAVVPKNCKCRLQSPSGTELPGHNPFLPPSAITQIMLIANPQKDPLSLKFMLSYTMDDETFTEMGEVDRLPTA